MPIYATAENENGQVYESSVEALRAIAARHARDELQCEECDTPIFSRGRLGDGMTITIYPESGGWNFCVLHTACDVPPALTDICDGQSAEDNEL